MPSPGGDGAGPAAAGAEEDSQAGRTAARRPARGRRSLKNWRVRSRLLLLVAIPTLTALILGGFRIVSSVQSTLTYQRVHYLASLGRDVTTLAQALEDERDLAVSYIAMGNNGGRADALSRIPTNQADAKPTLTLLTAQWKKTDAANRTVMTLAAQVGGSYPAQTQQAAAAMLTALRTVQALRTAATTTRLPMLVVVQKYGDVINTLIGFNDDIAQGAGDPQLAQTADVLGLVSVMKEDASTQRGILDAALTQGTFGPAELSAFQDSVSAQQTTLQAFDAAATPWQLQTWNRSISSSTSGYGLASADEQQALSLATAAGSSGSLANDPTTADDWYQTMSTTIGGQIGSVERQLVDSLIARAQSLRTNAIITAGVVAAAVLLVLAVSMLLTTVVGRSMVRPLRRLRHDALRIADVRLPEMVRRLSESHGEEGDPEVRPISVDSTDEIGQVARAFDQVHAEAVRLASNEARLRGNVNAMFINLSRRSQSLVERQIHLIDDLEQGEQDPDRLGSLFRLDHLATRMRRNSENLLVLAGHGTARRWTQPVPLVDVLRAAVSEIEHYERVMFNIQPGISVRGQVVNDVVHLLAELLENATQYSPAQTRVSVAGHLLNSGGVLLDITDQGVGMQAEEMTQSNWRLDNPPAVDVTVARRMGLFVVGRLAARHGIRVRLRPAPPGGLTALVWLPEETVSYDPAGILPGMRPFQLDRAVPPGAGERMRSPDAADTDPRASAHAAVAEARAPRFMEIGSAADPSPPSHAPGALPRRDAAATSGRPAGVAGRTADVFALPSRQAPPLPRRGAPADQGQPPKAELTDQPAGDNDTAPEPVFAAPVAEPIVAYRGPATVEDYEPETPGEAALNADSTVPPFGEPPSAEPPPPSESVPAPDDSLTERPGPGDMPTLPDPLSMSIAGDALFGAAPAGEANRLPIFESVESDWFRRGRLQVGSASQEHGQPAGWTSPADEGWRAAEAVESPSSAGLTPAGLPRRVPQANLVPGSVADPDEDQGTELVRSAAATRARMASYQRGAQEGRAAVVGEASAGRDEDAP